MIKLKCLSIIILMNGIKMVKKGQKLFRPARFEFHSIIANLRKGVKCPRCGSMFLYRNGTYTLRKTHPLLKRKTVRMFQCSDCGFCFNEIKIANKTKAYIEGLIKYMKLTEQQAKEHIQIERENDVESFIETYEPLTVNEHGKLIIKYLPKTSKAYQIQREYEMKHGKKFTKQEAMKRIKQIEAKQ